MSKAKNDTIGHVVCPFSGERAEVRATSPGKKSPGGNLYFISPVVGTVIIHSQGFRDWMKKNAVLPDDKSGELFPADVVDSGTAPVVPGEVKNNPVMETVTSAVKKEKSFLDIILGD